MSAQRVTERRAAQAARQLLYHRRLSEWICRKRQENEATLECYLAESGEERAVLLGGYVLERKARPGEARPGEARPGEARPDEDWQQSPVEVSEPIAGPAYEQLELLDGELEVT